MSEIRITSVAAEDKERIERWARAQNLRLTTAVKKALLDTVDQWERGENVDNG
ncbi:hypothetical protein F4560_004438 [Saccharothrix ecbatanensis]|uniref:Uncharacterized protein n=1 Tax=Saccharothrix ecbatanensis TaxID=1105145 RepID=A0A7W9M262_9PSEU|nr:hypothetical protein [Saccharothrix ecbatanensis]MBB5804670.1 hypothetical protein [Saccharothrix ecbatanensis]